MLEEMDEDFGIGGLVEEEFKREKDQKQVFFINSFTKAASIVESVHGANIFFCFVFGNLNVCSKHTPWQLFIFMCWLIKIANFILFFSGI